MGFRLSFDSWHISNWSFWSNNCRKHNKSDRCHVSLTAHVMWQIHLTDVKAMRTVKIVVDLFSQISRFLYYQGDPLYQNNKYWVEVSKFWKETSIYWEKRQITLRNIINLYKNVKELNNKWSKGTTDVKKTNGCQTTRWQMSNDDFSVFDT